MTTSDHFLCIFDIISVNVTLVLVLVMYKLLWLALIKVKIKVVAINRLQNKASKSIYKIHN